MRLGTARQAWWCHVCTLGLGLGDMVHVMCVRCRSVCVMAAVSWPVYSVRREWERQIDWELRSRKVTSTLMHIHKYIWTYIKIKKNQPGSCCSLLVPIFFFFVQILLYFTPVQTYDTGPVLSLYPSFSLSSVQQYSSSSSLLLCCMYSKYICKSCSIILLVCSRWSFSLYIYVCITYIHILCTYIFDHLIWIHPNNVVRLERNTYVPQTAIVCTCRMYDTSADCSLIPNTAAAGRKNKTELFVHPVVSMYNDNRSLFRNRSRSSCPGNVPHMYISFDTAGWHSLFHTKTMMYDIHCCMYIYVTPGIIRHDPSSLMMIII